MTAWLRGLSAFPLTPVRDGGVDQAALAGIVDLLAEAAVDSIGVLGSTGAYTYLTREQRRRVVEIAARRSGDLPVLAGIGHCATDDVLALAEDAQRAGADAVLLAPVTYQGLTDDEVVGCTRTSPASCPCPSSSTTTRRPRTCTSRSRPMPASRRSRGSPP